MDGFEGGKKVEGLVFGMRLGFDLDRSMAGGDPRSCRRRTGRPLIPAFLFAMIWSDSSYLSSCLGRRYPPLPPSVSLAEQTLEECGEDKAFVLSVFFWNVLAPMSTNQPWV